MTVHPAGWPFGRPTRVSVAAAILVDSLSVLVDNREEPQVMDLGPDMVPAKSQPSR